MRPLYEKTHKTSKRRRIVDFNQGIDSRLITEANMNKLAEVNIYPLRIAFDHWQLRDIYEKSIRTAVGSGIKSLSNYLLYIPFSHLIFENINALMFLFVHL